MGALNDSPRVIPLACPDLVALLLADRGLDEEEREVFRSFSDLVQAVHDAMWQPVYADPVP